MDDPDEPPGELPEFEKAYLASDARRIVDEGLANTTPRGKWVRGGTDRSTELQEAYDRSPEMQEIVERSLATPVEDLRRGRPARRFHMDARQDGDA